MKYVFLVILVGCVIFLAVGVYAVVSESGNYRLDSFSVGFGSNNASSSNYVSQVVIDSFGGDVSSGNYETHIGIFPTGSLRSCLNYSSCNETEDCVISEDCYLNNNLCSGGVCDFKNMNISGRVYVFYSGNDGENLDINLTGEILFKSGNGFVFFGKRAVNGGNGGIINISVPGLFNTTKARFVGRGGDAVGEGVGGDGGIIQLNYWGILVMETAGQTAM